MARRNVTDSMLEWRMGGDDCADCLRYLVATMSRTIVERKLRGR